MPTLEQAWPEWKIEKQLGRGTFGVVYQAVRQENGLTSRAAIKVISIPQDPCELESLRSDGLDLQSSRAYLKRIVDEFVSEIRLMETFKGIQNIVSIEDYKVVGKQDAIGWDIYIRMELLTPFSAHTCDRKLTEQEIIRLGCDICRALEICSQRNIIHRDIKPENIFVNSFGSYKLGDFGTARSMESLTAGLSQKGTFNYMAPEVVVGTPYDARVDIYSLGLVLYRLLNGNRLPFLSEKQLLSPGERRTAFERRVRGDALPAPCDASPALAQVILKACAYRPEDRYASAAELRRALEASQAQDTQEVPAAQEQIDTPPEPIEIVVKSETAIATRRKAPVARLVIWCVAGTVALLLSVTGLVLFLNRSPSRESVEATAVTAPLTQKWDVTGVEAVSPLDETEFPVSLTQEGDIIGIRIVSPPDKMEYQVGEYLNTEGLAVELVFSNGVTVPVEGYTCTPSAFGRISVDAVEVECGGFTASFPVSVYQPETLTVLTPPDKTEYTVGETLRTDGLIFEVSYTNGTTKIFNSTDTTYFCQVLNDGYYTQKKLLSEGTKLVYVNYLGVTDTFPITVKAASDSTSNGASATDFSFQQVRVSLSSHYWPDSQDGRNQDGDLVNWCLTVEFQYPENLRNTTFSSISCSWDDVVNGTPRWDGETTWQDAKEGTTYAQFATFDDFEDAFGYLLFLPDDPSIAGTQNVTVQVGSVKKTIYFTLKYLGDYDTGLGWAVSDIIL